MRSTKRILIAVTLSFLGLSVCLWYLGSWATQPAIQQTLVSSQDSTPDTPTEQTVSEVYFHVNIPSQYRIQSATYQQPTVSTQIVAYSAAEDDIQIGITAGTLPAEGLSGIGTYNYRRKAPDKYTLVSETPVTFASNDSHELTVYLLDSQRYASLSITSTHGDRQKLANISADLLKSWQWQPPQ